MASIGKLLLGIGVDKKGNLTQKRKVYRNLPTEKGFLCPNVAMGTG